MPDNNWGTYGPGSYVWDHEHDKEAHRSMMDEHIATDHFATGKRLTELEKFQQRAMGGFLTLGALLGGGLLIVVLHVFGVPV